MSKTFDKARRVVAVAALGILAGYVIAQAIPTGKPGATPTILQDPTVAVASRTAKSWGPYERPTFRHFFVKGAAANTSMLVT